MSVLVDPVSQFKMGSTTNEHLRDVCLEHLTLIHKMSETILAKDRQIKVLKERNHQVNITFIYLVCYISTCVVLYFHFILVYIFAEK